MRLLYQDNGRLALTPDLQDPKEPYAILSHTWMGDEDEVSFQELGIAERKRGYRKLDFLVTAAARDGLKYSWADTCCIDKSHGPELDEALNRMFEWYSNAEVCYVYLTDVPRVPFEQSRWFTRGWTLQELVAPKRVEFFDCEGCRLGDSLSLAAQIRSVTGITQPLELTSLAERFKWSLTRKTTKPEDMTYCVIGLMCISMRTTYGEGGDAARKRLLRKVEKKHGVDLADKLRQLSDMTRLYVEGARHKMAAGDVMKSLKFDQMDERRQTIQQPYSKTCAWLLTHPSYSRWVKERPFLWIKGKPGAGKSTLLKFAERAYDGSKLSFYFNARGAALEKSTLGTYRSLLYQLLESKPAIQASVVAYMEKERYDCRDWTTTKLQDVFRHAIMQLSSPIRVYVDALDECTNEGVQIMVEFMGDLTHECRHVAFCFASRYYPGIFVKNSIDLLLEREVSHTRDVEEFVNGRLNAGPKLKAQVIHKANGIFFWAMLVVRLLNQDIIQGQVHNMQDRLEKIPTGISALLEDITRNPDDQHILALRLILYTQGPLTLPGFYSAMLAGMTDEDKAVWDGTLPEEEDMRNFLHHCARGLAEQTGGRFGTVQFIHESVVDFLKAEKGVQQVKNVGESHDVLKLLCYRYVMAIMRSSSHVTYHPFLRYASVSIIYHAEKAAHSVAQEKFILTIQNNQVLRRVSGFCPDILGGITTGLSIAHILATHDAPQLIQAAHQAGCDLSCPESSHTPLMMAFKMNRIRTFEAILRCGADPNVRARSNHTAVSFIRLPHKRGAVTLKEWRYIALLIKHGAAWEEGVFQDEVYF